MLCSDHAPNCDALKQDHLHCPFPTIPGYLCASTENHRYHVYWCTDISLQCCFGYLILPDHHQHTCTRLLASTEASIGYRTTTWYITLTGVLFIPPILVGLIPLVFSLRLGPIFNGTDSQSISTALTVLLAYIVVLAFLYGMFLKQVKAYDDFR